MGKSNGFYQTIMAQETSILRYIELKDILHSTSKKELTKNIQIKENSLNLFTNLFSNQLPFSKLKKILFRKLKKRNTANFKVKLSEK